jgi:uncharacterized protein YjiS (DUF1127 family)
MGTLVESLARPHRAGIWAWTVAFVALWRRRARERRQLLEMSELQRHDIGITRVDVWREANKPFWRV